MPTKQPDPVSDHVTIEWRGSLSDFVIDVINLFMSERDDIPSIKEFRAELDRRELFVVAAAFPASVRRFPASVPSTAATEICRQWLAGELTLDDFTHRVRELEPTRPAQRISDEQWDALLKAGLEKIDFNAFDRLDLLDMAETLRWSQGLAVAETKRMRDLLLDLMARVIACGTEKNPEKLDAGTRSDRIPMLLQVCAERLGELNVASINATAASVAERRLEAEVEKMGNEVADLNSQVIRETADHFASLLVLRDLVANLQSREGSIIGVLSGEPGAASSPPEAKR